MSNWKGRTPCRGCGGEKLPGRGQRYCASCRDKLKPMHEREQYARRLERSRTARVAAGADRKLAARAPEGQKWCSRCVQYLALDEFGTRGSKLAAYCRPCSSAYSHERALARDFGITPEMYGELLALQQGRCAICERKPRARRLAVDHDHETGEVRGLLCTRCNHKLLGAAHESQAMLRRAATYLDAPPAVTGEPVPAAPEELTELLVAAAVKEAKQEAANAGADTWAAWVKRPGKSSPADAYVVMDGEMFTQLLREAGY